MMHKLAIVLISTLLLISWKYEDKYEPDELLIATFQNFTNCSKCYIQVNNELNEISPKMLSRTQVIAFVECNRKRELEVFRKATGWEYELAIDKVDIRSQLGLSFKTLLVLMKGDGTVLKSYDETNMTDANKEISDYLSSNR